MRISCNLIILFSQVEMKDIKYYNKSTTYYYFALKQSITLTILKEYLEKIKRFNLNNKQYKNLLQILCTNIYLNIYDCFCNDDLFQTF